ncbi:hypothetical protein [uncultured Thalassospira sp.]|jgi:hypothetical protein|uniref:hypothetical protein n=1 Tax=uncultured Thalassospira sp. TaxID=404382 RepID=UPI0030D78254|tara:strand:+ start:933 stop:1121 length:189 start_codon:yes stop_codon:yes gene_type:complete
MSEATSPVKVPDATNLTNWTAEDTDIRPLGIDPSSFKTREGTLSHRTMRFEIPPEEKDATTA